MPGFVDVSVGAVKVLIAAGVKSEKYLDQWKDVTEKATNQSASDS